jgi:hypothetical protein
MTMNNSLEFIKKNTPLTGEYGGSHANTAHETC